MIEHKLNQKELQQNLNTKVELKEEVIDEAKKKLENEGLLKEDNDKEKNNSQNISRKNSEDGSNDSKNNEYFLKEFRNNMINEFRMMEHQIQS